MSNIVVQFILGGLIVVGQTYFANNASPFVAGLIYSAPTLFIPSVIFIKDKSALGSFALHAAFMLLALFTYDISYYFLLERIGKWPSLLVAFVPWVVAAVLSGRLANTLAPPKH